MGYSTNFLGSLTFSRVLTDTEKNYINVLSNTRRVKRDVNALMERYKGKFGNPFATGNTPEEIYGVDGEFYVNEDEVDDYGQGKDKTILDFNTPPGQPSYAELKDKPWQESFVIKQTLIGDGKCQPGLWCQWVIEEAPGQPDSQALVWDSGEKFYEFYEYIPWLKYYINKFFEPWGVKLNGEIFWEGEDSSDKGKIEVVDNVVTVKVGKVVYQ